MKQQIIRLLLLTIAYSFSCYAMSQTVVTYLPRLTAKTETSQSNSFATHEQKLAYIQRFYRLAQQEQRNFGIPASVSLAQGLVESNAGLSKLCNDANNHFGMKCHSRKQCSPGHCIDYVDTYEQQAARFMSFSTAWASWRAHSIKLTSPRYKHLLYKDRITWAWGLEQAGYSSSKTYAQILLKTMRDFQLEQYDVN